MAGKGASPWFPRRLLPLAPSFAPAARADKREARGSVTTSEARPAAGSGTLVLQVVDDFPTLS